jgi:hypothetical protein
MVKIKGKIIELLADKKPRRMCEIASAVFEGESQNRQKCESACGYQTDSLIDDGILVKIVRNKQTTYTLNKGIEIFNGTAILTNEKGVKVAEEELGKVIRVEGEDGEPYIVMLSQI